MTLHMDTYAGGSPRIRATGPEAAGPLESYPESRCVQDEDSGFRVPNLPCLDQLESVRQGHRFERHEFVSFAAALAAGEAGCHEAVNSLVDEAGGREKGIKRLHPL